MRKSYPSDVSHTQFETIRPFLESARKKTRPRIVDLYDVFCAILYLLKSGCQWRMLPSDFPKWRTVHEYFQIWSKTNEETNKSLLEDLLKKIGWRGPYQTWTERQNELRNRLMHRASKIPIQQKRKDMTLARKYQASNVILLLIRMDFPMPS